MARLKDDLASGAKHPRQVKEDLAKAMVARYHSRAAADHEAAGVYSGPAGAGTAGGDRGGDSEGSRGRNLWLPRLMVDAGLAASTSEAQRLIKGGGVQVDGEKIADPKLELAAGKTYLLQVGKRRFKRVTLAELRFKDKDTGETPVPLN